jgi:hypothetical protein
MGERVRRGEARSVAAAGRADVTDDAVTTFFAIRLSNLAGFLVSGAVRQGQLDTLAPLGPSAIGPQEHHETILMDGFHDSPPISWPLRQELRMV